MKMFISVNVQCPDNILFYVPHREKPMKAKHICKKFPQFAKEMDGSSEECTLLYYYIFNKTEQVFEFKDPESEDEVAELMGVYLDNEIIIDEEVSSGSAKSLSKEEINQVHDYLKDIRTGLEYLKKKD